MSPEALAEQILPELRRLGADASYEEALALARSLRSSISRDLSPRQQAEIWIRTELVSTMTEPEWLAGADPDPMLKRLRTSGPTRELTLFGCACCRRIWDLFPDERCRQAVALTERFFGGSAGKEELDAAYDGADQVMTALVSEHDEARGESDAADYASDLAVARNAAEATGSLYEHGYYAAVNASLGAAWARARAREGSAYEAERAAQAALLREIAGNPFRR